MIGFIRIQSNFGPWKKCIILFDQGSGTLMTSTYKENAQSWDTFILYFGAYLCNFTQLKCLRHVLSMGTLVWKVSQILLCIRKFVTKWEQTWRIESWLLKKFSIIRDIYFGNLAQLVRASVMYCWRLGAWLQGPGFDPRSGKPPRIKVCSSPLTSFWKQRNNSLETFIFRYTIYHSIQLSGAVNQCKVSTFQLFSKSTMPI